MRINFHPSLQTQQTIFDFLRERLEQTDMSALVDFKEGRMKYLRFIFLKVNWSGRIILRWYTRMLASAMGKQLHSVSVRRINRISDSVADVKVMATKLVQDLELALK
jgi:hypothetical protein